MRADSNQLVKLLNLATQNTEHKKINRDVNENDLYMLFVLWTQMAYYRSKAWIKFKLF